MLVEILIIVIMVIVCFILYEPATTSPIRWHPPYLVDNADTLYLGDHHWQQIVLLFQIFTFLWFIVCLCVNQSVCVSLSVYNRSQVFKNSLWWGSQLPFSQKIIMYCLVSGEWGFPLEAVQITDKEVLIGQDVYIIFCLGL